MNKRKSHKIHFNISKSEVEKIIDDWVLDKLHREVLKLRHLDNLTYEEIAEKMNISDSLVKKIIYGNEDVIRQHMNNG